MEFSRILVRATNWLGDAVMSLPALRCLRDRFPHAHIAVQAMPWVADLYAREKFQDEIILYEARRGASDWRGKWRAARRLRAGRFDCAILLTNSFDSALILWLAGIPKRIGYDRDGRGLLLTDRVRPPAPGETPRHERYYYLELLRRAGILEALPEINEIRLDAAGEARAAGEKRCAELGLAGPVIGVSPGAAYGGAKRWLPERFAEAAAQVAAAVNGSVAVFGSKGERPVAELVMEGLRARGCAAGNFAGDTALREYIDLAAACRLFLTNDSGAMHVAAALGVPTVAVFGSTDDVGTGPVSSRARVVREPVDCSPCLLRECPIDHRCMTRVPAERVAAKALELLK
ncbi:MAG TPA: lipopolysaccharide heptosyltransferase II [Bryobacteraceae bacterium]|nr:lipopolysaccharide heptosyltransferase II [Bryobacteraceae bacterium]